MKKEYYIIKNYDNDTYVYEDSFRGYCSTNDIFMASKYDDYKELLDEIKYIHDNYDGFDNIKPVKIIIAIKEIFEI